MRRQKSILSFFQKPPPENQKSLASDVLGERRDSQLPVKIQNQKASNMSYLTEPLDEIRGTDTPPEKVPRPVLQPKFSSNDGFRGSSVFSSIMHKFVKPGDKESASERNNSLSDSSHYCEVSNKVNKPKEFCEGVSSQLCKNKDIIKSSGKIDQSFVFNVKSDDDIRGPETPGSQRLVPRLKRIQDDDPKSGDKRDRSLLGSVKKMKLSEELMHLNENSGQHSGMASKFEWLDPSRIRDAHGRSPSDPFYDKTTLYIPPDALKKMSASQRQYWDCKCQYMDIVLFFKVGKFYELYELDAEIGHKELDWKMTLSGVGKCRQVGISESGIDDAIQKLVSRGYKVGRIEQMETSEKAKARGSNSVIQRKLVQVVSPATTIDSNIGPDAVHLLAIKEGNDGLDNGSIVYGFAFADCAALKFWVGSIKDDASFAALGALLMQVSPKEIIFETGGLSKEVQRALRKYSLMGGLSAPQLTAVQPATDFADASEVKSLIQLKGYFKGSSSSRTRVFDSLMHKDIAISALGGITSHLSRLMLDDVLRNGDVLPYEVYKGCLKMDGQTLLNLEVFSNSADGGTSGTLFKYLNSCMTSPGKRLLRRWICHPLKDIEGINSRLNVVEYLLEHPEIVLLIAQSLHKLSDLERLLGQIRSTFQSSAPLLLPLLGKKILKQRVRVFGTLVKGLRIAMDLLLVLQKEGQIFALLSTIFKFPKLNGSDGLFQFLTQFEAAIDSDFPNYQNHELKDQDAETLSILIEIFIEKATQWSEVVYAINCIDVLRSFAVNAGVSCGAMSRPVVLPLSKNSTLNQGVSGPVFKLTGLWHPFALAESGGVPVPNDIILGEDADSHHPRTLLLTGPNMGGKSTLLRTACLAVILAQLGCYVPCETCVLSLVDIIFTRLGATDRIMAGESTFFIECTETAAVLQNATQDSLVILDELGRGTSTFDGYAIAYAVFRHLIEKINCRLLFATHYHPLTKEFASHPHVTLKHMACKFKTKPGFINISKELVFLYRLASGACPESYGLQVATMAGIPDQVVKAASEAGQTMKESIGESFKCSEMRCEFSTLHEDWLKTLLTVSGTGYSNPDEDDVFDTLLCLWHEVNRSYENFEKSCSG